MEARTHARVHVLAHYPTYPTYLSPPSTLPYIPYIPKPATLPYKPKPALEECRYCVLH
jgi:hypothetical protein